MSPHDRGHTDRSVWLVLVYDVPPFGWGFMRAASGKCWWRRIEGRGWAVQLGRKLAEQGIHGVCRRVREEDGRSDRQGLTALKTVLESSGVLRKSKRRPDAYKVGKPRNPPEQPYAYPYPEALAEATKLRP